MNAEIINIGDELLIGQVVNTNCSYIAKRLNSIGGQVKYITVISDDKQQIKESVINALKRSDCVLITGGLGPTKDDMTKYCLNEMFGGRLIENKEVCRQVEKFFTLRNLPFTDTNKSQALVPDCCKVIFNRVGTAPGMVFMGEDCKTEGDFKYLFKGKLVISMPGVPFEMQEMMAEAEKIITEHYSMQTVIHKSVLTGGIGESFLSDKLTDFEDYLQQINKNLTDTRFSLAYLPKANLLTLRLSAYGGERKKTEEIFENLYSRLKQQISQYIIGEDGKDLAMIIGEKLKSNNRTLATAESCTGGNIAHVITRNSGASGYFKGGVVAYSNEIKHNILSVSEEILSKYGAVSMQTAKQMAEGVRNLYNTDFAIATTGLAGPDSDGTDTEVGTVYIALAQKNKETKIIKNCYKTTRTNFIDRVTNEALTELFNLNYS